MERDQMIALVERHLKAEGAGDVDGAVAVYTDDVEHDVVGWPTGPVHGKEGAREFYRHLTPTSAPRTSGRATATSPTTPWSSTR
jgi:hypothetical protein